MSGIYKPCPYCGQEILKKPILEKQQGAYSILCPYCLSHRCEWVETIEQAIASWNVYLREEKINRWEMKHHENIGKTEIVAGK